jgi:dihydropyrimidinase
MGTLIRNGQIVTAADDYRADILIEDGRIAAIGHNLATGENLEVCDAGGQLVLPGGIDVHTHLEFGWGISHTVDTFASGGKAAAFGGTTTLVDFCSQIPGEGLLASFEVWRQRAERSPIDVGAHAIIVDLGKSGTAEMEQLMTGEGVTSFKLFTAYPGTLMADDGTLLKAMRTAGRHGGQISVHCENGHIIQMLVEEAVAAGNLAPRYHMLTRPPLAEGEATERVIRLAEVTGTPLYIVHLSARQSLEAVAAARRRGVAIHAETCTHYLFLTDAEYDRPGFEGAKYIMSPPLRAADHVEALWQGIATGDLSVVSTDHCPYSFAAEPYGAKYSKRAGGEAFHKVPNGAPGIEERMAVLFSGGVAGGRLSASRFVELTATAPAKLFGLYPQKGTIAVGSDADLVLLDPKERWTIRAANGHGRMDYSLFEGFEATGRIKKVFLRGEMIVDGDTWLGREGGGRFISRGPSGRM